MILAGYIKKKGLWDDPRVREMISGLEAAGSEVYPVSSQADVRPGTDALLSLGGDGTFLSAARIAVPSSLPVLGVNLGRLGFLSECRPEDLPAALRAGEFRVEERKLLQVSAEGFLPEGFWPFALNETGVSRIGASMLGVDVELDGETLPTWWADGLLVATSTGSTAYSLSVGGPICTPDAKVFIVAPISPHNLNVRPLVVPNTSRIAIGFRSREDSVALSVDNRTCRIPAGARVEVCASPCSLKRLCIGKPNFINALRTRLLWGEDVRNGNESL
mgnify:FL=1